MKLSITPKRWLVTVHILFAAIMFGNMITFLILSITAATANDSQLMESCYQIMHVLSKTSVKAATFGTIVTGILLSVLTKWGLFKFYWIIAKEALTIIPFVLNMWAMYYWSLDAINMIQVTSKQADSSMLQTELWTGIIMQLISLILMFILSVFKPWGKRQTAAA
ncbi:hypothetical protein [Virgibacillus oceani]|uniref:DUF2269 domain-containing protein n=1 Tax=Virgibacillus oceani TaxID=1479511 RepID=A0A917H9B6_9BACI|nr:hypothetical protein [Virgibacillus oceani]GGG71796.1 hypothetical protein GCM10011398_15140 [Virgibacillus oceani]